MDSAAKPRSARTLLATYVLVVLVGLAVTARPGHAGLLAPACPAVPTAQVFAPWLDPASYQLVGDGGFENGAAGWALGGGARVVAGNEPWSVRGAGDGSSLLLPAGAQATSPATCIGLLDPTTRFFASGPGSVAVEATIHAGLLTLVVPVGVTVPGDAFAPSLPLPVLANLTTLLGGGTGSLTLHFTALGGSARIDDVYVDPFKVR